MIQKILHRVILFASLLGLFLLGSKVIAYYQTGANHKTIYLTPVSLKSGAIEKTKWIPNGLIENHPNIKFAITKDLHFAWEWLNKNVLYQSNTYLENHFHDDMIAKINQQALERSIPADREVISHTLELMHLSLDKSVAVVKDHSCVFVQRDVIEDSQINFHVDTISYTAILVFSDGIWKINNWISEEVEEGTSRESFSSAIDSTDEFSDDTTVGNQNSSFQKNLEDIAAIRGINYYPQEHPWHDFWDSIDIQTIKTDFSLVKELNMNTLRIFIPFQTFSKSGKEKEYLQKLDDALTIADEQNLRVQLTLFDFPVGFHLDSYTGYNIHLENIVRHVKDHPALLAWNIKNEPDLDFEAHGTQAIVDWLGFFIDRLRDLDPIHPITTSWSDIKYLPILAEKLDFLSFHMYIDDSNWQSTLQEYQLAYKKPILLEEFGISTRSGFTNLLGHSEKHQLDYITDIVATAEKNNVPWMLWTLYDFKQIPDGVFRSRPWILSKQSHFGLIRKDGSQKEIYRQLKDILSK